jgi:hypothetical protein
MMRDATKIQKLAKKAIATLNNSGTPAEEAKVAVTDSLVEIVATAAKMDARTGRIDPTKRRKRAEP